MRYHECRGERYRADSKMNFLLASAQKFVRKDAVGHRLPVIHCLRINKMAFSEDFVLPQNESNVNIVM